jgi:hypothetical protein
MSKNAPFLIDKGPLTTDKPILFKEVIYKSNLNAIGHVEPFQITYVCKEARGTYKGIVFKGDDMTYLHNTQFSLKKVDLKYEINYVHKWTQNGNLYAGEVIRTSYSTDYYDMRLRGFPDAVKIDLQPYSSIKNMCEEFSKKIVVTFQGAAYYRDTVKLYNDLEHFAHTNTLVEYTDEPVKVGDDVRVALYNKGLWARENCIENHSHYDIGFTGESLDLDFCTVA